MLSLYGGKPAQIIGRFAWGGSGAGPSPQTQGSSSGKSTTGRPCTYCRNLYHFPDNCQQNPSRSYRRTSTVPPAVPPQPPQIAATAPPHQPTASNICYFNFNKTSCTCTLCKFTHTCSRCGDRTHRERWGKLREAFIVLSIPVRLLSSATHAHKLA